MSAEAELVADAGTSAAGEDLFRSPAYLAAEGVTHTLRIESPDRVTSLPLIVREISPGGPIDAVSPYGYPGGRVEGTGPAPVVPCAENPGCGAHPHTERPASPRSPGRS